MGDLVFWQNVPSIHMAPLIGAVAPRWRDRTGGSVRVVCEAPLPESRRRLGWSEPDFGAADVLVTADPAERGRILAARLSPQDVHICSGFDAYPATWRTLRTVMASPARSGVFAERPKTDGSLRAGGRVVKYRLLARRIAARLDFLLAAGTLGCGYFTAAGFRRNRIFPFGYFTRPEEVTAPGPVTAQRPISFIFVGEFAPWKGADLLLEALSRTGNMDWHLDMVGDGPDGETLRAKSERLGIGHRVRWHGPLPNSVARAAIGAADCLILPSRYDGWGAVVNEALMAGTRVIVSDAAGANDLIAAPALGRIVPAGKVGALTAALAEETSAGPLTAEGRDAIRRWAEASISPDAAADHLLAIIAAVTGGTTARPTPPWAAEMAENQLR